VTLESSLSFYVLYPLIFHYARIGGGDFDGRREQLKLKLACGEYCTEESTTQEALRSS
jgi:hypothetical protein